MIEDYKITDNKVTAYDSNKGFIDFEYQENIDDIFIE